MKIKNSFTISKHTERCHDTDILKDAKLLDAISSALEDNESSPRLTKIEEKLEDQKFI